MRGGGARLAAGGIYGAHAWTARAPRRAVHRRHGAARRFRGHVTATAHPPAARVRRLGTRSRASSRPARRHRIEVKAGSSSPRSIPPCTAPSRGGPGAAPQQQAQLRQAGPAHAGEAADQRQVNLIRQRDHPDASRRPRPRWARPGDIDVLKAQIEQTQSTRAAIRRIATPRSTRRCRDGGRAERQAGPDAEREPAGADHRPHRRPLDDDGAVPGVRTVASPLPACGLLHTLGDPSKRWYGKLRRSIPPRR